MTDKQKVALDNWLTALRSGKHAQGRGGLCNVEQEGRRSYCCLGVFYLANCPEAKHHDRFGFESEWEAAGFLISETVEEYGFSSENPSVLVNSSKGYLGKPIRATLSSLNDERRLTFEQIADIIEVNAPFIFSQKPQ